MKLKAIFASLSAAMLTACSGVDVTQYVNETPKLDLPLFLNGSIDAWGVFQKRSGEVARRFTVDIQASWKSPDEGTLDEHFLYADGEKQRRVWTLKRQTDGSWQGTADDVVGVAIGHVSGNALHWKYVLKLPVDGKIYEVNFDDWMWQMDGQTMLNRSTMSKFGFDLGEVTLFFRKRPDNAAAATAGSANKDGK
jgi:hypothetical protein